MVPREKPSVPSALFTTDSITIRPGIELGLPGWGTGALALEPQTSQARRTSLLLLMPIV